MRGIGVLIILSLFIYPSIAQNADDHVYLSSIGAYRSTFEKVSYNADSEMRMGNIVYPEGIQFYSEVGSTSENEHDAFFNLNKTYNRLTCLIGIDDKSSIKDGVTLTFTADDRELQKIDMLPADLPVSVDLDVSGVRRLMLHVNSHENEIKNHGYYQKLYIDLVNTALWKLPQP